MTYQSGNGTALKRLLGAKTAAASTPDDLTVLAELRVSQVNGCAYCVDLHTRELLGIGYDAQKIACLTVWREADLFSDLEKAVLDLAEAMTVPPIGRRAPLALKTLSKLRSEQEVVDLAYRISTMNALNRLSISFEDKPEKSDLNIKVRNHAKA